MTNPIALVMVTFGLLLMLFGIFLAIKSMRITGILISVLGLGVGAIPFVVTLYLGPNP